MKEHVISRVPLFASLPRSEIEHLAKTLQPRAFPDESLLFVEGNTDNRFYILLDGQVEIIKALGTDAERLLGIRAAGSLIGEMSLFSPDGRHTASVRTRTAVELLEMTHAEFDALLHRQPSLAYEMVRVLSLRLDESENLTIRDLLEKNRQLKQAYDELKAAQAQIIEKEKLEAELEAARTIQESILPRARPHLPGWHVTAHYRPAREVGGDFYDFLELPDRRLGLVIGDATDKGVPAALLMAATRSLLRACALDGAPPGAVLERVNDLLHPDIPPKMFVTCLYAVLDPASGQLRYANAGHNLPYWQAQGTVTELRATGMPLGLLPGMGYDEKETVLRPGESVLFYSDGLVEAHSPQREMFGFPRLARLMGSYSGGAGLIDFLLAELRHFTRPGWEQEDDVTLVVLQYLATPDTP